jgi:hypothetical protein
MNKFKVSKHFQNLPSWQQTGAQIQLTHWLKKEGHLELAGNVCAASSNEALTPHLSEVDKVLPTEVTREQIFPKVFADPLTIRHELTATIGKSVRKYPKGSTEGEFSIEDKISILSALRDQIEEVGKKTKFTKEIEIFLQSDRKAQDYEDRLDALVIEAGGYLTGLNGTELDETIVDVSKKEAEKVVDAKIYGALAFLDLVERQDIQATGSLKPFEREAAKNFLLGAGKVWDIMPRFTNKLSRYWGKAVSGHMGDASDDLSESIGQIVSQITEPRLKLSIAARLPKSLMVKLLHLYEVEKFIYARGWLKGHAEYKTNLGSGKWVSSLRNNVSTILARAINMRNPGYVVEAASELPIMIDFLVAKAKELDEESAKAFLSNRNTMITHALEYGELKTYLQAVFEAIPKILDTIAASVKELDEELADILLSNKRSITYFAIRSGKLEKYIPSVSKLLPQIREAIETYAEKLDEELTEILLPNRGSIISHAIQSGKLDKYPLMVIKALPKISEAIEAKSEELDEELAEVLMSNKGSIISCAISSGRLERYPQMVVEALPEMDDAIKVKAKELNDELAEILLSNKRSITRHALASGKLKKYPPAVFEALPKIVDTIAVRAEELDDNLAEILISNKATIIHRAISSGRLEKYVEAVLEALPILTQNMNGKGLNRFFASGRLEIKK